MSGRSICAIRRTTVFRAMARTNPVKNAKFGGPVFFPVVKKESKIIQNNVCVYNLQWCDGQQNK